VVDSGKTRSHGTLLWGAKALNPAPFAFSAHGSGNDQQQHWRWRRLGLGFPHAINNNAMMIERAATDRIHAEPKLR
jgi:hypothetical protein